MSDQETETKEAKIKRLKAELRAERKNRKQVLLQRQRDLDRGLGASKYDDQMIEWANGNIELLTSQLDEITGKTAAEDAKRDVFHNLVMQGLRAFGKDRSVVIKAIEEGTKLSEELAAEEKAAEAETMAEEEAVAAEIAAEDNDTGTSRN